MKINIEIIEETILDPGLLVYGDRLEVLISNKNTTHELIYLIAALLGNNTQQILKVLDEDRLLKITCEAIDLSKINEVVFKVNSQVDYCGLFGEDLVIDIANSTFYFEPNDTH